MKVKLVPDSMHCFGSGGGSGLALLCEGN